MRRRLVLFAVALVAAVVPSTAGAALRAGVAVADITPPNGGTTFGFVRPDVSVRGVHTRLTGRALVLDDGKSVVALLATDLGAPFEKDSLVARVHDLGFTHDTILYSSTHTHSGPGELAPWQVAQLAAAIRRAYETRVPVRAGWGAARVTNANQNRSIEAHLANHGIEQFYGEGMPGDDPFGADHSRDVDLRLLRVDRMDGRPLAAWTNFPVHLTTSTPAVDVWDADLAAAATQHLSESVATPDFVALYANGSLGDLMPRFDAYSPTAAMDLEGRRIARGARVAWRAAKKGLTADVPLGVRWTRTCFCGQVVDDEGHRVDDKPVWGLPFLGGSEDGASIFHEPAATEGKRTAVDDPVQGYKIPAAPGIVHESNPEVQVIRVGDRLLLGAPGEPSVEMGRRFREAVTPVLPAGVKEPVIVGLANDYIGYMTTPEEYQMQHYEGGHTVFGHYTSLLIRNTFVDLTMALSSGAGSPAPSRPAELGASEPVSPAVGDGGVAGALVEGPQERVERMGVVTLSWTGAADGVDRPADTPFLVLERATGPGFTVVDSDLGLGFYWRETEGGYGAIYDVPASLKPGAYRVRVLSGAYTLETKPFEVVPSQKLVVRGVAARAIRGGRTRLVVRAQNPAPDPGANLLWRPKSPTGGVARLVVGGRSLKARWNAKAGGWVARVRGAVASLEVASLRDRYGNRIAAPVTVTPGKIEPIAWPPNIGVGGGRTPGPLGQGEFPP
jgi:neutral ceramidase